MITNFNQYLLLEKTSFDKLHINKKCYKLLFDELKSKSLEIDGNFEYKLSEDKRPLDYEDLDKPVLFIINENKIGFKIKRYYYYINIELNSPVQMVSDYGVFWDFMSDKNPKIYILETKIKSKSTYKEQLIYNIINKYHNLFTNVIDDIYIKLKDIYNDYKLSEYNIDDVDYVDYIVKDLKLIKYYKKEKTGINSIIENCITDYIFKNNITEITPEIEKKLVRYIYTEFINTFLIIRESYSIKNLRNNPNLYHKLSKDILNKKYLKEIGYLSNANKFDLI